MRLDIAGLLNRARHFINFSSKIIEASGLVYKTLKSLVAAIPGEALPGKVKFELQNITA